MCWSFNQRSHGTDRRQLICSHLSLIRTLCWNASLSFSLISQLSQLGTSSPSFLTTPPLILVTCPKFLFPWVLNRRDTGNTSPVPVPKSFSPLSTSSLFLTHAHCLDSYCFKQFPKYGKVWQRTSVLEDFTAYPGYLTPNRSKKFYLALSSWT